MNQENLDKMILLVWVCFSIRFLFFSYWDILLWPPILLLVNEFNKNIQNHELSSGDSEPEAIGRHTQEESKFKEQKKRLTSLDFLIQIMIQEELQRIEKKLTASSK
ncbi:hypothetical protein TNCT_704391 [Trichonephila clavata]|uniref:Uncharacterized protein n=1 Tax=Trichonephila clavata TaxID=2740835 RepID=A0A8X6KSI9_TRICU|nr:hypothetical protein TNCT_704391 [Trichonephila clavata]